MEVEVEGTVRAILEPSMPPETACFNADGFRFFLTRELAESNRYGHFSALAIFRIQGPGSGGQVERLVRCLAQGTRATDFMGRLNTDTVGIIIQHATIENARRVMERLHEEVARSFPSPEDASVKGTIAVFPTEANTQEALTDLAQRRLEEQSSVVG
jgi:hypothetical protein